MRTDFLWLLVAHSIVQKRRCSLDGVNNLLHHLHDLILVFWVGLEADSGLKLEDVLGADSVPGIDSLISFISLSKFITINHLLQSSDFLFLNITNDYIRISHECELLQHDFNVSDFLTETLVEADGLSYVPIADDFTEDVREFRTLLNTHEELELPTPELDGSRVKFLPI